MNRLGTSASPYLRQHADNPVDWYPWGEEAFAAARDRDLPVLLSIGYSSCHWCHVMAHESFEDPEVAAVMNRDFVNIKVDREERPDIDAIYMQAVQATTGRGGWPMTVFLAPDGRPFFAGTYFPKEDRHGLPGMTRLLGAVHEAWEVRRAELLEQAAALHEAIDRTLHLTGTSNGSAIERGPAILDGALQQYAAAFDEHLSGFGGAPKFPPAMAIDHLLERHVLGAGSTGPRSALTMATATLDAMAAGGIYDHLGGGFHRYSVDASWLVPHFEKMLYDQALLIGAYLHAWQVTGEPRYRRVVEETVDYVLRELRHPEGGFSSAEDADSEGVEGKFYVWAPAEIAAICGTDADEVRRYFGVTEEGNFEDPHTGFRGSILHVVDPAQARTPGIERGRAALLAARDRRVRPGLDDKILLAWNALFCRSLAEAASAFERDDWMEAARTNASFLLRGLRRADGRLLRSFPGTGGAPVLAYAEDYAALLHAVVTLAELDDVAWLDEARAIAAALDELFADRAGEGVFTTGHDAETLIVRPKDIQDGATPSENSLAAGARLRLAALTGSAPDEEAAARWLRATAPLLERYPQGFPALLGVLGRHLGPPLEIVVVGDPADPGTAALWRETTGRLLPGAVRLRAAPGADPHGSPLLESRPLLDARPTAYVCERFVCRTPVNDPATLREHLDAALARR